MLINILGVLVYSYLLWLVMIQVVLDVLYIYMVLTDLCRCSIVKIDVVNIYRFCSKTVIKGIAVVDIIVRVFITSSNLVYNFYNKLKATINHRKQKTYSECSRFTRNLPWQPHCNVGIYFAPACNLCNPRTTKNSTIRVTSNRI